MVLLLLCFWRVEGSIECKCGFLYSPLSFFFAGRGEGLRVANELIFARKKCLDPFDT